jgi:hypothetical protein
MGAAAVQEGAKEGAAAAHVTICLHQLVQELVGVRERKNDELLTNNRAPHAALNTDYQT